MHIRRSSFTFAACALTAAFAGTVSAQPTQSPAGPARPAIAAPDAPGPIAIRPGLMGPGAILPALMIGSGGSKFGTTGPDTIGSDPVLMHTPWDLQDPQEDEERRGKAGERREGARENRMYDQAQRLMDRREWKAAIERFDAVLALKGTRADAALYWKAWAQHRTGQRSEALTTIATLAKEHPQSRYLKDAKALEVEVRSGTGQPVRPEDQTDDELKLIAIQALLHNDAEQTVPMLEKLLASPASPKLKERALFVLAQSRASRAREVLANIARGSSTPDLQVQAINYLGIHGGRESRAALSEVYAATSDTDVKRRIMRAFMIAGERERLLTAAQAEADPELRAEAVKQLGVMGAHDALWALYQKERATEVKKQILHSMFVAGQAPRMIELARTEPNVELRRVAVRNLGLMARDATSAALVELYRTERDSSVRGSVIEALFIQDNAAALVELARKEGDVDRRRQIVQKLSHMTHSAVARDYMLELLDK